MNHEPLVLNARVRLYCCGLRCEKFVEVDLREAIDAEDVADHAREQAELDHGWQFGCYCPEHQDSSEPYDNDFDTGDFDPYTSRE